MNKIYKVCLYIVEKNLFNIDLITCKLPKYVNVEFKPKEAIVSKWSKHEGITISRVSINKVGNLPGKIQVLTMRLGRNEFDT